MKVEHHYINYDESEPSKIDWIPRDGPITWFNDTPFYVWITVKGLDYLNQYRFSQTALILNQASLHNYKTQRTLSWVTLAIVAIGSFFSALTFFRTDARVDETNKKIHQLKEQVEKLQHIK